MPLPLSGDFSPTITITCILSKKGVQCGLQLFDRGESGHPANVGRRLWECLLVAHYENTWTTITTEMNDANDHNPIST